MPCRINYKQVGSFSELTKNDHKKLKNILNVLNAEVCGSDRWSFLLRKEEITLPKNTCEIQNTIDGRIETVIVDGAKFDYYEDFEKFFTNAQPMQTYSLFNDKILFPAFDKNKIVEIIYYTNAEEEGGSPTAEGIVAELSQQADFAVIMDVARPNWGIVTQRKGNAKYKITVTGKGGHHGNASQCCANAIHQLAYTITELHKLASPMPGKPEDFTAKALEARGIVDSGQFIPPNTVNVGVIGSTNDKISVIPGDAYCEVNVRCFEVAEQKRLDAAIKALADKIVIDGTKVEVTGGIVTGPMEKTPAVQKMIDVYSSVVAEEFGGKVNEWVAGGLTDGNRTAKFIPTLDALGVENYDEHTDHESVDLKTAVPRTAAFAITLAELLKTGVK